MTTTESSERGITLLNIFAVTPEKQETAAAKIAEIYENFVRNQPGFIVAEIHKSLNSTTYDRDRALGIFSNADCNAARLGVSKSSQNCSLRNCPCRFSNL